MLFIVVSGDVPDVDGATLVSDNESRLVGVETHAGHWRVDLKQSLALLGLTTRREGRSEEGRERRWRERVVYTYGKVSYPYSFLTHLRSYIIYSLYT